MGDVSKEQLEEYLKEVQQTSRASFLSELDDESSTPTSFVENSAPSSVDRQLSDMYYSNMTFVDMKNIGL